MGQEGRGGIAAWIACSVPNTAEEMLQPESNASVRVLTKCELESIGEVLDPADALVRRWEQTQVSA